VRELKGKGWTTGRTETGKGWEWEGKRMVWAKSREQKGEMER